MKKAYIWGGSFRGIQIKGILESLGVEVCGVIDRNVLGCMKPEKFFEICQPTDVVVIGSIKPETQKSIIKDIKGSGSNVIIMTNQEFHYKYEIPFYEKNSSHKYEMDFEQKMKKWFDSFLSEVKFWKNDVATPSGYYWNHYIQRLKPKEFICERISGLVKDGDIVLDVGCGICSQYGKKLNNGVINLVGIDPLAPFYNKINDRYYKNYSDDKKQENATVVFGMFELLSYMLGENYADFILIDNALDHCIDPYSAIIECLKVVKIGGMVSTRHHVNEAYKAMYSDLHQWNICADDDNKFIIWNQENYIDVKEYLDEYVEFDVRIEQNISLEAPYGNVICNFVKKKDIPDNLSKYTKKRTGFVMGEMMRKLADIEYANELIVLNE